MPWNAIQAADVQNEILPDEVAVLNAVEGGASVLPTILANCLAEVQAQILVGGNQVGQPGTLPDQIRSDVIAFVRWKWFCALPKTDLQSDFRKAQYEEAIKRFTSIREGKEKVEIPANPQNTIGPSNRMQAIRTGPRNQDWGEMGHS